MPTTGLGHIGQLSKAGIMQTLPPREVAMLADARLPASRLIHDRAPETLRHLGLVHAEHGGAADKLAGAPEATDRQCGTHR